MADERPDDAALAWARGQVERVAVKYDEFATREPNPIIATCYQFTARILRLEFCGGLDTDLHKRVIGRFEPGFLGEQDTPAPI